MDHTPVVQDDSSSQQSNAPLQEQIVHVFEEMLSQALMPSATQAPVKRKRGRPPTVSTQHLWLAVLIGIFQASGGFRDIWRYLVIEPLGTFPVVKMTYEGVRKRLLSLGSGALQELSEHIRVVLEQRDRPVHRSALALASFATEIVALDESTWDKLKRLLTELKSLPENDPHLLMGKIAGLYDLRRQQWRCLQLRTNVLAGCNVGILPLLEGLPRASLILADLGYFAFEWFDTLTEMGYFYISRLRENGTYITTHILYQDEEHDVLDAIVFLGTYRADKAAHAVRLVQWKLNGIRYRYITNVLDPLQLPMLEIAQLYARRWDIELMFKLLKRELGLSLWWAARQELVEIQLWIALILAQILCALRFDLAEQADVDLFDVSLPLLIKVLGCIKDPSLPLLQKLVENGRAWGVIRPNRRNRIRIPALKPDGYHPLPEETVLHQKPRYAKRNPHPPKKAFLPRYQDRFLLVSR